MTTGITPAPGDVEKYIATLSHLGAGRGIFPSVHFLGHARVGEVLCTALGFEVEGPCTDQDCCAVSQSSYCYFSKKALIQFWENVSRHLSCLWLIHKMILAVYVIATAELQSRREWNKNIPWECSLRYDSAKVKKQIKWLSEGTRAAVCQCENSLKYVNLRNLLHLPCFQILSNFFLQQHILG